MELSRSERLCVEIFELKIGDITHECIKCGESFDTHRDMQEHNSREHAKKVKKNSKIFGGKSQCGSAGSAKKIKIQMNDPRDPLDVPPKEIPIDWKEGNVSQVKLSFKFEFQFDSFCFLLTSC
jgi:hypothetical protein